MTGRRKRRPSIEPADLRVERETLVRKLERERESLEQVAKITEERYLAVEKELTDLASLYVVGFQLAGTLSVRRVVRHLCELLEQMIGAHTFAVYVLTPDGQRAVPIASRGPVDVTQSLPAVGGHFGDVCLTGRPRIEENASPSAPGEPIAVLPMHYEREVVGVISISELLPQKSSWGVIDHELFKLVCAHGATALIAANLYESEAGPRAALHDIHENLKRAAAASETAVSPAEKGD